MRATLAILVLGLITTVAGAQAAPDKRFGVEADLKTYPQSSAKEALASVIKAIDNKRVDYLLAHLAEPQFVDQRVKENGGKFDEVLQEATAKLLADPGAVKQLKKFQSDGEWKNEDNTASVSLKDVGDRVIYLRKVGDRWFMENRRKPEPVKPKEP